VTTDVVRTRRLRTAAARATLPASAPRARHRHLHARQRLRFGHHAGFRAYQHQLLAWRCTFLLYAIALLFSRTDLLAPSGAQAALLIWRAVPAVKHGPVRDTATARRGSSHALHTFILFFSVLPDSRLDQTAFAFLEWAEHSRQPDALRHRLQQATRWRSYSTRRASVYLSRLNLTRACCCLDVSCLVA